MYLFSVTHREDTYFRWIFLKQLKSSVFEHPVMESLIQRVAKTLLVMSEGRRGEGIIKIPFPSCHIALVMAAGSCTCSCKNLFWALLSGSSWQFLLCFISNGSELLRDCALFTHQCCAISIIHLQIPSKFNSMLTYSLCMTSQISDTHFRPCFPTYFFPYLLIYTSFALQIYVIHYEYFMQNVIPMGFESCW